MDYDSSSKFISSLAKFLQSLCNGYVEFDSGVQVIGHLYLSVDTGKTIDYILNEKVCKTDENSVTFISNSFHAQPAEKPKPTAKKSLKDPEKTDLKNDDDSENFINAQGEPRSTNIGTLPPTRNTNKNSPHLQGAKRPFSPSHKSQSKPGQTSPRHKKSRTESLDQNISQLSNPASENSISSAPSPAADNVPQNTISTHSSGDPPVSHLNESYQQSYFHPDEESSLADESEERDIKPSIDTDVTFIKEEYAPSSSCSQSGRDRTHVDEAAAYSYQTNQVFPGGYPGQGSFGASQRSNFNSSGSSHMFSPGQSSSKLEENSGDPSALLGVCKMEEPSEYDMLSPKSSNSFKIYEKYYSSFFSNKSPHSSYTLECRKCTFVSRDTLAMSIHKRDCKGKRHLTCPICCKILSRYDSLAEHMRGIHGIGDKVECKFCGKNFKYRPQMYQHQAVCAAKVPKMELTVPSPISHFIASGVESKISFPYDVTMSVDMDSIEQLEKSTTPLLLND